MHINRIVLDLGDLRRLFIWSRDIRSSTFFSLGKVLPRILNGESERLLRLVALHGYARDFDIFAEIQSLLVVIISQYIYK